MDNIDRVVEITKAALQDDTHRLNEETGQQVAAFMKQIKKHWMK